MTTPELSPLRPEQSGVFMVPRALPTLRKVAQRTGCAWFEVDLHAALDKAGFLAVCARDLNFPAYFGATWDAFSDCINDLAWVAAPGYVIVFENVARLAQHAPEDSATALEILRATADAWRVRHKTFVVLLDYVPPAVAVDGFPEPPLA
jgi:Barstar (barnase inhibitor)